MTGDPLPRRMERLPRDVAGRPVPWFVAWVDGKPDFRLIDSPKLAEALRFRRCWVCGETLGAVASFPLGPMCVVNRTVSEPGSHLDCAEWSARNCFAGETSYWTRDGLRTLAETVDTVQEVLSLRGWWVPAEIRSFGEQRLWRVVLRRNGRDKVIHATADHRWLVGEAGHRREVLTRDLSAGNRGDHLSWTVPRPMSAGTRPSPFGVAAGVVFGDGSRSGRGAEVCLFGDKDAQLLRYFAGCRTAPVKTAGGVLGVRVSDLPGGFKDRPSLAESDSYLYGWLAGYFAADGNVTRQGQAVLDCADRDTLDLVQLVAARLGIVTWDVRSRQRQGYGAASDMHSLQLVNGSLRPEFFVLGDHQRRFVAEREGARREPRMSWRVIECGPTDRVEEVYCAVVPETEQFVLDGWILTKNCPFLANPDRDRRTNNLPDDVSAPAGDMLLRNPGAVAVYSTRRWKVERHPGGVLLALGEPTSVSWWAEGRPATRAEVEASIRSGMPFLEAACDREPEARRERAHRVLRDQAESAAALLPEREEP